MSAATSGGSTPRGRGHGTGRGWDRLAAAASEARPAYLVRGDDPTLVADAVRELLRAVTDGDDPAMTVEEHGGLGADDLDVGAVVDACTTPPFLADRRVVVVRDAGRVRAEDAARLVACLADPLPGVVLVLAAGGGTVPAALVRAVEASGVLVDTDVGSGRARTEWLVRRLHAGPVRLDARAAARLGEHLGGDMGRVRGLLDVLAATYGEGAAVGEAELEPFLGQAGSVAPWELTDAIDAGDAAAALEALGRLSGPGGFHPLATLAVLHRHFETMLRLDGSGVTSAEEAAARLGARSVYPVKKALEQGRRLGPARLGRAVVLLAEADLDLRGRSALDGTTVLQVLVARLSRLGGTRRSAGGRRG